MRSALARLGHACAPRSAHAAHGLRGVALRCTAALSLLGACTAPQTLVTARHTSCKPREIEISELTYSGSTEDWLATCRDLQFRCQTREVGRRLLYACKPVKTRPGGHDAGMQPQQDAGSPEPRAAGALAPRDAGALAPPDTGLEPRDAGALAPRDAGALEPRDAGITEPLDAAASG